MLQPASRTPLAARQIPIWKNGVAIGFIDLALERAYVYREHAPSEVVEIPAGDAAQEKEARYSMLERLADYDDALMEELISDIEPPRDQVFDDLAKELRDGLVAPLFIGSAERGAGVTRLLKALRHEAPGVADDAGAARALRTSGPPLARVLRTIHTSHGGKLSLARVLRGAFVDGQSVLSRGWRGSRSPASRACSAATPSKRSEAREGRRAGLRASRACRDRRHAHARRARADRADARESHAPAPEPVHAVALAVKDRKDEMRLAARDGEARRRRSLARSSCMIRNSREIKLLGQGEMHLRVALERLAVALRRRRSRFTSPPSPIRRRSATRSTVRGRHKKQSGGHGQFGDVVLEVAPRGRGEGFAFSERVHGGAVPRQYFSSVEAGCQDALAHGPLGFPVVDVEAVLIDGSYHSVDSSDMAFRTAARVGMSEALAQGGIRAAGARAGGDDLYAQRGHVARHRHRLPAGAARSWALARARAGKAGTRLETLIPEAEMENLIVELRSATSGAGFYEARFDHLAEVTGRHAREVTAAHAAKGNGAG